ncbi:MAG: hypothetical protein K0Q83_4218 [Deltaproteobacteria bacterium]|nr:hypothetical protein [Deltaproteobacteria bacterium]
MNDLESCALTGFFAKTCALEPCPAGFDGGRFIKHVGGEENLAHRAAVVSLTRLIINLGQSLFECRSIQLGL